MIENIPPKGVSFSDFIHIFVKLFDGLPITVMSNDAGQEVLADRLPCFFWGGALSYYHRQFRFFG